MLRGLIKTKFSHNDNVFRETMLMLLKKQVLFQVDYDKSCTFVFA